MLDKYSTERALGLGLTVKSWDFGHTFVGSREALQEGGYVKESDFPTGRKRIGIRMEKDEYDNWISLERIAGGQFKFEVRLSVPMRRFQEKLKIVQQWIDGLPSSEDAYRDRIARGLSSMFHVLWEHSWSQASGGYQLRVPHDDFVEAMQPLLELARSSPVSYSEKKRRHQISEYRLEGERENPVFQRFLETVTQAPAQ